MSPKKLIIDTDGVADDVRAVSLALQNPSVQVLAITCVNGCVNVDQAVANMARTLRANGKKTPIYRGAEHPLVEGRIIEDFFFGKDGLGDSPHEFPAVEEGDLEAHEKGKHASLALYELFSEHPDATLVCIGPLTNIALTIKLHPEFVKMPNKMIILGGNIHGMGNVRSTLTAEYNFGQDPEAAHIVIKEMRCEVIIIPWEAFIMQSANKNIDFHAHLSIDVPLARYFNTVTKHGRAKLEKNGKQYAYVDEIAMGVAIDPENIITESKMVRASVELRGELTRGQMAVDWLSSIFSEEDEHPGICRRRRKIHFVIAYNVELLDKMIFECIRRSRNNNVYLCPPVYVQ